MKQVQVQFNNSKASYSYAVLPEWEVVVGDKLIVDSPHTGFTCVEVLSVSDDCRVGLRVAVDKVDIAGHQARIEKERAVIELKRAMEARKVHIEERKKFSEIAKTDSIMRRMLLRLDQLGK